MSAPIAYLEKTKKKRDDPSSSAIFAELGTKANKTDETKTKNIPGSFKLHFICQLQRTELVDFSLR